MQKIVVGLSGGVDSAVAAGLLRKEYEVYGVTLQMQGDCFDLQDAENIAKKLGIKFDVIDCQSEFNEIKNYFATSYLEGKTPNPCCKCNPEVKWAGLIKYADKIGAEFVATGHYAFVDKLENGRYALRAADSSKDQTYALYGLSQEQLSRTIMPLGKYTKEEVREMAREMDLPVAEKPDSMEVCFIPDDDHAKFIEGYANIVPEKGKFVDEEGGVLGEHQGITHYTVGQRKGLGIAFGKPMFVKSIDAEKNEVVLCDNERLFATEVRITDVKMQAAAELGEGSGVSGDFIGRIRYSHKGEKCSIIVDNYGMTVRFASPVRAATPGQSLVIYDESGHVVLGGIIADVSKWS